MQARTDVRPGEYGAANFLRANGVRHEPVDGMSDGMVVSLFGSGVAAAGLWWLSRP